MHLDYFKNKDSALSRLDALLLLIDKNSLDREVKSAQNSGDKICCAIARAKRWMLGHQVATETRAEGHRSWLSNFKLSNFIDALGQMRQQR